MVSLAAGLALAFNSQIFFNDSYSADDVQIGKILMIFLSINLAISFPASVFEAYITSQEKFIFQKIINIGKTILSPCLCIAALYLGYGSIGMVVLTTVVSIIVDLFNIVYCLTKLQMKFMWGKIDKALLKEIAIFSFFIAINQVIDQINWQTDKIILGKMVNGTAVAIYAVGSTINTMYISFSSAISSVFTPKVHKIVAERKQNMNEELTNLFIKVGRIQFFVLMLILTGFIFFGKHFVILWAGENYEQAYFVALLLMCPATISLIQNLGIEIQRAKNKHQIRSVVYLIMALLNVGLSIWLCQDYGVIGVALGTTISLVLANGVFMNLYYQFAIKIDIGKFWLNILKILPSFILPVACGTCFILFVPYDNHVVYFSLILTYTLIYCLSIYLFGLNQYEKGYIHSIIKSLFKRHNDEQKKRDQNEKSKCAGCWGCVNICPKHCISMHTDNEGFEYPVIDKSKCVNCGLCSKVCPILHATQKNDKTPLCYACFSMDEPEQLESSSGGVFSLIAKKILEQNGVVYGAAFKDAYTVEHLRVEHDIAPIRKSKYLQSRIGDTYSLAKKDLDEGKLVLFTGTGCQIEGLKNFLMKDYANLITQDIICHGVSSPKVWEKYLKEVGMSKNADVNFRDKYFGWRNYCLKAKDGDKCVCESQHQNDYMKSFLSDVNLRPSCYDCKFKQPCRCSDITLGDFWGIEKVCAGLNNPNGASLVVIHSEKGQKIFDEIKSDLKFQQVDFKKAISSNPSYLNSARVPKNREKFFKNIDKKPINVIVKKYCQPAIITRAFRKAKHISTKVFALFR